jgi:hypothetical protein
MLKITHNLQDIDRAVSGLPGKMRTALTRTLNRTIASTRQFMVNQMSAETGIPALIVEKKLRTIRAEDSTPEAEVTARTRAGSKRIPILQLRARQVGRGPTVPGGVVFQFAGETKTIGDAFIARMPTGHRGVFSRTGRRRVPIIEEKGPAWRTLFERAEDAGLAFAERELAVNAEAELRGVAASV